MQPKISAIVLTYNQENTVGRTIESILAQETEYPLEIIIGEDCSKDSTRSVCEKYAAEHPSIIKLMPVAQNKGVVGNFIDCLKACTGDFVALCAGDDWWSEPRKLQKQVSFLCDNPQYIVVHGEMKHYNTISHSISEPPIRKHVPDGYIQNQLYIKHIVMAPTACIRRSALIDTDFDSWRNNGFIMEDLPSWLELATKGKFHFIPEYLTTYSVGGESVSNSSSYERQIKFEREAHKIRLYYYLRDKPSFPKKRIDKLLHRRILKIAIRSGNDNLIREISREADCGFFKTLKYKLFNR